MLTLRRLIAFAGVSTLVLGSASVAGGTGATFAQDPSEVYVRPFSGDLCFIRANADDTDDLLVWSGDSAQARLVAVDGKSGQGIWETKTIPHLADAYLHCVEASTFLVGGADFTVRSYESVSARERWVARVSDKPAKAAVGAGCVLIETDDKQRVGLSLDNGSPKSCTTKEQPGNWRSRANDRARLPFTAGGLTITLTKRAQGTPMLTLAATRGKQPVWQTPLDVYSNIPFALPGTMAYSDRSVFVGGRNVSSDISTAVIGVDAASGRVLWKAGFPDVDFLAVNGGALYAAAGRLLMSLDPATGGVIWRAKLPGR